MADGNAMCDVTATPNHREHLIILLENRLMTICLPNILNSQSSMYRFYRSVGDFIDLRKEALDGLNGLSPN